MEFRLRLWGFGGLGVWGFWGFRGFRDVGLGLRAFTATVAIPYNPSFGPSCLPQNLEHPFKHARSLHEGTGEVSLCSARSRHRVCRCPDVLRALMHMCCRTTYRHVHTVCHLGQWVHETDTPCCGQVLRGHCAPRLRHDLAIVSRDPDPVKSRNHGPIHLN